MFSSPLRSPKPKDLPIDVSPLLAAELGIEYASLRAPRGCPVGMYITPSSESVLKWHGVFFVHKGPYAGSILRFTLLFPPSYPQTAPTVRFDSDVFHPMVDPKTKVWHPRGRLSQWRPRADHVSHVLHSLKGSFKVKSLESIGEDEAINKQVWSLYHHSHQTFISMTSQRALHSSSRSVLYPDASYPANQPPLPHSPSSTNLTTTTTPTPLRTRKISGQSMSDEGVKVIRFNEIDLAEQRELWDRLKRSLEC
ncbi:hypothetical protein IAT40_006299 [Kwoniella sp. CBS 6097]